MSQYVPSQNSPYGSASSAPGTGPHPGGPGGAPGYGPAPAGAPGYGNPYAPGVAPGFGAAAPAPKGRKDPLILTFIGLAMIVVGVIALVISISAVSKLSSSLQAVDSNGSVTATLEPSTTYGLYSKGLVTCEVTDPDGGQLDLIDPPGRETLDDFPVFAEFTTKASGDYTVTCQSSSNTPTYIGLSLNDGGIVGSVFGILLGGGSTVIGLIVLVAGVIWLSIRNSSNKRALAAQTFGGAQSSPPPSYGGPTWQ